MCSGDYINNSHRGINFRIEHKHTINQSSSCNSGTHEGLLMD